MKNHEVKFTIKKGGGIAFEVMNGEGNSCSLVTKDIELHLSTAGKVVSEGKKPEYYEQGPDMDVFQTLND